MAGLVIVLVIVNRSHRDVSSKVWDLAVRPKIFDLGLLCGVQLDHETIAPRASPLRDPEIELVSRLGARIRRDNSAADKKEKGEPD